MSGRTILELSVDESDDVIARFRAIDGGAPAWRTIVDRLERAPVLLRPFGYADDVEHLDGGRFLGRGARLRAPRPIFIFLLGVWAGHPVVAGSLEDGSLVVTRNGARASDWIRLGSRLAERLRQG